MIHACTIAGRIKAIERERYTIKNNKSKNHGTVGVTTEKEGKQNVSAINVSAINVSAIKQPLPEGIINNKK